MSISVAIDQQSSAVPTPEYVLDIVDLQKSFRRQTLSRGAYSTLKSFFVSGWFGGRKSNMRVTRAIEGLTLRIPKGDAVGIIGRNGSGKSTLLKLVSGIYRPDHGSIAVKGRIAALIELGAGFHPDFTGRENLFLGGILHGLTRAEIDQRFDEIVAFAELQDVIDDPVRTYSSGMFMRLGFSLAVHTQPDILIVDEVLAVGDAAFVSKCKEKIAELRKSGTTLLLVSHDLEAIERWSDEVLWLHEGRVKDRGEPRRVIDHYRQFVEVGEEADLRREQTAEDSAGDHKDGEAESGSSRWGSREIEILSVRILDSTGEPAMLFHPGDGLIVEFEYVRHTEVSNLVFGIGFSRTDGLLIHGSNTHLERVAVSPSKSRGTVRYRVRRLGFLTGNYRLDVAAHREDGYPYDYHQGAIMFAVRSNFNQVGICEPDHVWET